MTAAQLTGRRVVIVHRKGGVLANIIGVSANDPTLAIAQPLGRDDIRSLVVFKDKLPNGTIRVERHMGELQV